VNDELADNYTIAASASAARDANKLPTKIFEAVNEFVRGELARNPKRVGHPLRKPYAGLYSARRGTYRIVYSIDEGAKEVTIVSVAARSDVYRPR
jgi:mRNA interferase RelE/StbE